MTGNLPNWLPEIGQAALVSYTFKLFFLFVCLNLLDLGCCMLIAAWIANNHAQGSNPVADNLDYGP
jgi:hypothetical protein